MLAANSLRVQNASRVMKTAEPRAKCEEVEAELNCALKRRPPNTCGIKEALKRLTPADRLRVFENLLDPGETPSVATKRSLADREAPRGEIQDVLKAAVKELVAEADGSSAEKTEPAFLVMPGMRLNLTACEDILAAFPPELHPAWTPLEDLLRVTSRIGHPMNTWRAFPFRQHWPAAVACTIADYLRADDAQVTEMLANAFVGGFDLRALALWRNCELFRAIGHARRYPLFVTFFHAIGNDRNAKAVAIIRMVSGLAEKRPKVTQKTVSKHVTTPVGFALEEAFRLISPQPSVVLEAIIGAPRDAGDKLVISNFTVDFYARFSQNAALLLKAGLVQDAYAPDFFQRIANCIATELQSRGGYKLPPATVSQYIVENIARTAGAAAVSPECFAQLFARVPGGGSEDEHYLVACETLRYQRFDLLLAVTDKLAADSLMRLICFMPHYLNTEASSAWWKAAFDRIEAMAETNSGKRCWESFVQKSIDVHEYLPKLFKAAHAADGTLSCARIVLFGIIASRAALHGSSPPLECFADAYNRMKKYASDRPKIFDKMCKFVLVSTLYEGNDEALALLSRLGVNASLLVEVSDDSGLLCSILENGQLSRYLVNELTRGVWHDHAVALDAEGRLAALFPSLVSQPSLFQKCAKAFPHSLAEAAKSEQTIAAILDNLETAKAAKCFWRFPCFRKMITEAAETFEPKLGWVLDPNLVQFLREQGVVFRPEALEPLDSLVAAAVSQDISVLAVYPETSKICSLATLLERAAADSCWDLVQEIVDSGRLSAVELAEFREKRDCVKPRGR